MRVTLLQTKECLEPAEAKRGKEGFSPGAFGECGAVDTSVVDF